MLTCANWLEAESHAWAWACCITHARTHRAAPPKQLRDGDDGQPAGAASASSVEGVRRGRSDVWPYPMARKASPAASAHVVLYHMCVSQLAHWQQSTTAPSIMAYLDDWCSW